MGFLLVCAVILVVGVGYIAYLVCEHQDKQTMIIADLQLGQVYFTKQISSMELRIDELEKSKVNVPTDLTKE